MSEIAEGVRLGLCLSGDAWDRLSVETRNKLDESSASYEFADGVMHIWIIHEDYLKFARLLLFDARKAAEACSTSQERSNWNHGVI